MPNKTRKIIQLSLLLTLGAVIHSIETLVTPTFSVPGAKIGIANIVTVIVLELYGFPEAILIAALRVIFGSFLSGTFLTPVFWLGFSGAVASSIFMGCIYKHFPVKFSVIGLSILGAMANNIAQLCVGYFIIGHAGIFAFVPWMIAIAIPSGLVTGRFAQVVIERLRKTYFFE